MVKAISWGNDDDDKLLTVRGAPALPSFTSIRPDSINPIKPIAKQQPTSISVRQATPTMRIAPIQAPSFKPYLAESIQRENNQSNLLEKILNPASIQKRAELSARARAASDLISSAYSPNGMILDPIKAEQAKTLSGESLQMANALSAQTAVDTKNMQSNDMLHNVATAGNRLMAEGAGNLVFGADNSEFEASDVGRFLINLLPGTASIAASTPSNVSRAITGRGIDSYTGEAADLTPIQRLGSAGTSAIDAVGVFLGGSGTLIGNLLKAGGDTAKKGFAMIIKNFVKDASSEAVEEGSQYLTELMSRDGDLSNFKVEDLSTAMALGAAGGGVMNIAGSTVGAVKNGLYDIKQQKANMTPNEVKRAGEGGYIRTPSNKDVTDVATARANIINSINQERLNFIKNEKPIKDGMSSEGTNKTFNETKKLFNEFAKNPDKFVDKYELLPPEYRDSAVKSTVTPKPTAKKELAPVAQPKKPTDAAREALLQKSLDQKFRYSDGIMTRREKLEKDIASKNITSFESKEVPKYEYNRTKYNRMNQREQDAYDIKMKEKKTIYVANNKDGSYIEVPKSVHDYYKNKPVETTAPQPSKTPDIPSYIPKDRVDDYLKSSDYIKDQEFKRMADETKSGDPFDHPDMYENPTPEMKKNLKTSKSPATQVTKTHTAMDTINSDPEWQARMDKIVAMQKNSKVTKTSNNLYHTTPIENLDSIRANGLTSGNKPRFEGVSGRDNISFSANEKAAQYYGGNNDVLIRTKTSYKPKDLEADLLAGGEGVYTSKTNVPPEMLEVKINGKWQPLVTKTVKPVPTVTKKQTAETVRPIKPPKVVPDATSTAKTGEKGKSKAKASKGRVYQKSSNAAAKGRGLIEADKTTATDFIAKTSSKAVPTAADIDTALALQSKIEPGTNVKEYRQLGRIAGRGITEAAQIIGSLDKEGRKTATAKQMTSKFINGLVTKLDDDRTIPKDAEQRIQTKNREFEQARTAKDGAYNRFQAEPTEANARAYEKAHNDFIKADTASLFEEYNIIGESIKNGKTKNTDAKKLLDTAREESGIYFMDYVDTNMLSSTRTMINNYINTMAVSLEESAFGGVGAKIARKLVPGAEIGGGSSAGRKIGKRLGWEQTKTEAKLRQGAYGNKALNAMSNVVTTGNTLGDRNIMATAYAEVYDAYRNDLKQKGYTGAELERRAKVETLADPKDLVKEAKDQAMADVGLAGLSNIGHKAKIKIETLMGDQLSGALSEYIGYRPAKVAAKVMTRTLVGFPTVAVRSVAGGVKRTSLGGLSVLKAVKNALDPNATRTDVAKQIKKSIKEFGSGATMMAVGGALASQGLISGAYPDDKDEREQWKREGKSEYSIKLGDSWWNIPQALGVFSLPFMVGANAYDNVKNGKGVLDDIIPTTWETIMNLSPLEQLQATTKLLQDPTEKAIAGIAASATRALTPLGSFVNQLAKMFDPTANDTTQGDVMEQFLSKVKDGIPGLANTVTDKEVEGNKIENVNPIARLFGAVSKEQSAGVQKSQDIKETINAANKQLKDNGIFTDNIRNILDDETKVLFDRVRSGKDVDESDSKKLMNGLVKGVTESEDTRFLEDGDYDSNLAVLKTKRSMLEADPTTRKETLENYDKQIKRGEIYKKDKIPYSLISAYSKTSLTEWREMGDPESDAYDPEMYQALYDIDSKLSDGGVSRSTKAGDKNKYYAKATGSGSSAASSAKKTAKAMLDAAADKPLPTLPSKPTITKATYRQVPVTSTMKSTATNKYAPIKVSAKSATSARDKSRKNMI